MIRHYCDRCEREVDYTVKLGPRVVDRLDSRLVSIQIANKTFDILCERCDNEYSTALYTWALALDAVKGPCDNGSST